MMASATVCRQTARAMAASEKRFSCAELIDVAWQVAPQKDHDEYAILAEIWSTGGVLLVDEPAEPGTIITMSLPDGEVQATVRTCRREESSYALEVSVSMDKPWFQRGYDPHVLVMSDVPRMPRREPSSRRADNPAAELLLTVSRRETLLLRRLIRRPVV